MSGLTDQVQAIRINDFEKEIIDRARQVTIEIETLRAQLDLSIKQLDELEKLFKSRDIAKFNALMNRITNFGPIN